VLHASVSRPNELGISEWSTAGTTAHEWSKCTRMPARVPHLEHRARSFENGGSRSTSTSTPPVVMQPILARHGDPAPDPPVVVRRTAEPGVFAVENVGRVVALTVRVEDVEIAGDQRVLPRNRPGATGRTVQEDAGRGSKAVRLADTGMFSPHFDEDYANQTLTVIVRYENVEGRPHSVPVTVAPGRVTVGSVR